MHGCAETPTGAADQGCFLDEAWLACTEDRDCVLIQGFCGSHAVNGEHAEAAYENYFGCLEQAHCAYFPGEPKAACDRARGKCVTRREGGIKLQLRM